MKRASLTILTLVLAGLGVGVALTNPGSQAYEDFAVHQLTWYLKENVCSKAPEILGNSLRKECLSLVDVNKFQIKQLIARNTRRQNYIFFSIYTTELTITPVLPSYRFETFAGAMRFYLYSAEQY
ncbi:hypothetical protein BST81_01460 [Leptolyngbya sp. 'hensonii']|uniref:DUF4359 domain-containing protein n=1 Tax=Leptolyngbya sp. 'hensonii' TaxID=1922337 RepID=UPI00095016EB|nr:DUF4359 domain-containing protein [Leptolyngbya sp. 'hensonii']OLP20129.1 hypothetical protein BST81_01460 [Leptolyngbya sp. 'hensonii']